MPLSTFHPLTRRWFAERFPGPTEPQRLGWPAIAARRDTLIAAPTGSGKTLAAFMASLDRLLRAALAGELAPQTYVLYVSPLRALSNDIQRNLRAPLSGLLALAQQEQPSCPEIRALVRTGDTPAHERQSMVRKPPHILVTTPESLYLLLTGKRSREILRAVDTVIVDEIHALARDKRGSHLALSLERLEALCRQRPVRIGLSATQKPLEQIARLLVGVHRDEETEGAVPQGADASRSPDQGVDTPRSPGAHGSRAPVVIDAGHLRALDVAVEVPERELQAVCTHEHWAEIYDRLVSVSREHRSTLIFVNTRRLAERVSHQLSERLGADAVASHHGSLSHRIRHRTEQRLKQGELKAVVATASLELGIDIGHIDLVCQLGSPRSLAALLQRVGRAGHSLGVVPKGRLFALTREELVECLALVRAIYAGRLDGGDMPRAPLDILAQQIVAAVACEDWDVDELFQLCRRAYPYRDLSRQDYEAVLEMLSDGIAPQRGRRGAYLHWDRVGRRLRARRPARLTAITSGGAIPETADYRVVTDDEQRTLVGTVNEDFAVESLAGDIFLLGNTSWKIRYVRGGEVVVSDAHGAPPSIPFWLGEAPGRTAELSAEVSRLRGELAERSDDPEAAAAWLAETGHVSRYGAEQAVHFIAAQQAATGLVPTQRRVLFERFFDEAGGMQLVVHAPFGARINRAWGLALRKRFCRTFNFELQASADDNGIVLSLGPQHSFSLEQMFHLVPLSIARDILVQALLAVPMFTTRWRWNVTRALGVRRWERGGRVPPPLQRMRADDMLSAVFPTQTACAENVPGDIEVPDHPLVKQTVHDCLHEAMDLDGWLELLHAIQSGSIELVGLDTREPSPFSHQLLNANPYAFLDDAPLEERRARAVALRRSLPLESVRDLGRLDPEVIARVRAEAWPVVRDADELHDALYSLGALPGQEGRQWVALFEELRTAGRATLVERPDAPPLWVATEHWPLVRAVWPEARARPEVAIPPGVREQWSREQAFAALVRGRLECVGPVTEAVLAQTLGLPLADVHGALISLEVEGTVLRGRFTSQASAPAADLDHAPASSETPADAAVEWCERRLLARIHRLTLQGLRQQIQPVSPEQFVRFLIHHQHLHPHTRMRAQAGLMELIEQLEGFEAPAADWEQHLLSARMESYSPAWLDGLALSGQVAWGRLRPRRRSPDRARPMKALTRTIPLTLMLRQDLPWLLPRRAGADADGPPPFPPPPGERERWGAGAFAGLGSNAMAIYEALRQQGALFASQLATLLHLLPSHLEDALGELAAAGLITSDGFAALRNLIGTTTPLTVAESSPPRGEGSVRGNSRLRLRRRRLSQRRLTTEGGRWSLLEALSLPPVPGEEGGLESAGRVENWCRLLLRRYGVMLRDLLARESAAPPWRELVATYRRLEARGQVHGGRFVAQVAGEQYALPEIVSKLRRPEDDSGREKPIVLSATDPLNLWGRVLPGPKVPASPGNRLVVGQGRVLACRLGPELRLLAPDLSNELRSTIENLLGQRADRASQQATTDPYHG